MLNVESGLNDGLALPFVLIFLAVAAREESQLREWPWSWSPAWRLRVLTAEPRLQALGPLAIAVMRCAACHLTHANPYLAAFAAGSTLATMDRVAAEQFEPFGDLLSETTKFAALRVFGALITPSRLSHLTADGWALAVLAILLVRPAAMLLSLIRTRLSGRERLTAAWFGPKGFASVVYGLLALQSGIPAACAWSHPTTCPPASRTAMRQTTTGAADKPRHARPDRRNLQLCTPNRWPKTSPSST